MRILCLFLFIYNFSFSQTEKIEVTEVKVLDNIENIDDAIISYFELEQIPLFDSCKNVEKPLQRNCFNEEMKKHVEKHLKYPKKAKENKIECRVHVEIEIDKEGKTTFKRVKLNLKDEYAILFEEEVKRIIAKLPQFLPAMQRGKNVKTSTVFPINFKL